MSKEKKPDRKKPLSRKKPASKKVPVQLPRSGLASDILKQLEKGDKKKAETGPDRVYAFTDRVRECEETAALKETPIEERLETWVLFSLKDEVYALPVSHVREILRSGSVTRVPDAPYPVLGITNLRGRVLPVVDLRLRMGLEKSDRLDSQRILVTDTLQRWIGILVDSVLEVVHLDMNQVKPPPEDIMTGQSDYLTGVYHMDELFVILLDADRVLMIHPDGKSRSTSESTPTDEEDI